MIQIKELKSPPDPEIDARVRAHRKCLSAFFKGFSCSWSREISDSETYPLIPSESIF